MRVLHLLKTSVGAVWACRQMRELVRLGVEVHCALPPGGRMVGFLREGGVTVHLLQTDFPASRPWRLPELLVEVRRLVHGVVPHLVHSHFLGTTLIARLALGKDHLIPRVFQVPGPLHLEHPFFRRLDLSLAGPSDHWVGSCRWTTEEYLRLGVPAGRVHLSYYGTDVEASARPRSGRLRRECGFADGVPLVGIVAFMYAPKPYLGQVRGLKGHEDLFDAMGLLGERHPAVVLAVVGGAWERAAWYERRVRDRGRRRLGDRVVFLGTRTDVPDLYPDLDVAVHPSHSENVGGAVESLLAGVPTVASNVGGLPDLVVPGETGWLVPPRSPEALSLAIGEALDDRPRALALAARGRDLARELFDVRRTAGEVRSIYEAVLGREAR